MPGSQNQMKLVFLISTWWLLLLRSALKMTIFSSAQKKNHMMSQDGLLLTALETWPRYRHCLLHIKTCLYSFQSYQLMNCASWIGRESFGEVWAPKKKQYRLLRHKKHPPSGLLSHQRYHQMLLLLCYLSQRLLSLFLRQVRYWLNLIILSLHFRGGLLVLWQFF